MAHRFTVEAFNDTLKDLMRNKLPFGNKNIIFAGDFPQIPPVVKYGSKTNVLQSNVPKIFRNLKILYSS